MRRSEAEPALSSKAPVHPAIAAGETRDMAAEMLFERGRPGDELKAESVIDHGEAARRERETLAVGAGDIVALGGAIEGKAGFLRQPAAESLEFAPAQRLDQVAAENDPAMLPRGQSLTHQMLGAFLHSLTDLGPETTCGQRSRIARQGLPVEPGRTRRRNLALQIEVRAHGDCHSPLPSGVVEPAQLDDGAGCAVTGRIEIGKLDVMGSPIDAVDHGIGRAFEFVIEPARDQPADDRRLQAFAGEHIVCRAALYAALGQRAVHTLDDVAALAKLAQHRWRLFVDRPLAGTDLLGKTEGFELAQPPEL